MYNYVPESGATAEYVGNIEGSLISGQVLGGTSVPAFAPFVAAGGGADLGALGLAALAIGAGAVGVALLVDRHHHDDNPSAPPAAAGPMPTSRLADGSDSGVKGDRITNDNTPTITGTGTAGDKITITLPTGEVLQATVAADGTWSATPLRPLPEGAATVLVSETNAAGATGAATPLVLTIDTTPPAAPTASITHTVANDTGISATDSITSNKTPSLSGTGDAGTTITVAVDGGTPYTTTVAANGTWTVATTGTLADGAHTLTVTSTDAAGNVATGTTTPFTVDTVAPTVAPTVMINVDTNNDGYINAAEKGTATTTSVAVGIPAGAVAGDVINVYVGTSTTPVATYTVGTGGVTAGSTQTLTGVTLPADGGTLNVSATITDAAGNLDATKGTDSAIIDATAPVAPTANLNHAAVDDTGASATDSITSNKTPALSGTGEAGTTITVVVDGGTAYTTTVAANGTWTVATTATLPDGPHTLTVTSTDTAGNVTTGTTTPFTVDTTAPAAPTASITHDATNDTGTSANDSITSNKMPTLAGTGEAGTTIMVAVDGGTPYTTTVAANGTWSVPTTVALADGTHTLTVTSTDAAGNVTTGTTTPFTVDTTAPTAPTANLAHDATNDTGASNTDSITSNNTPNLSGTGEAGTVISVTVAGTGGGTYTTTVGANGTWTVPTTGTLADGQHTLTVSSTDAAGNVTTGTTTPFTVDTTAPVAPTANLNHVAADDTGTSANDSITSNNKPTLAGTGEAGTVISVTVAGTGGGTYTATVGANGTWTVPTTGTLSDGQHTLTVTSTDAAGNVTTGTTTPFTVDTVAPTVAPTVMINVDTNNDGYINIAEKGTATTTSLAVGIPAGAVAGDVINVYVGTSTTPVATYTVGAGAGQVAAGSTQTVTGVTIPANGSTLNVSATITDAAGNLDATKGTDLAIVDTTAPVAPTANLNHVAADDTGTSANDSITSNNKPTLAGTGEAGTVISVTVAGTGGGTYTTTVGANGTWTVPTTGTLSDGQHTLTVTSTDAAGNITTGTTTPFTVDTTAPVAPTANLTHDAANDTGSSANDNLTNNVTPSLSGTGEAGTVIQVAVDGGTPYTTTVAAGGTWTVPTTGTLADGQHTLTVTSTDAAGNVATGTTTPFTVDHTPPAPTITVDSITSDNTINLAESMAASVPVTGTVGGEVQVGDTVTLTIGNNIYTGLVTNNGGVLGYSINVPGSVLAANTSVVANVSDTDAAGNTGSAGNTHAYTVDTAAPVAPTGVLPVDSTNDTGVSNSDNLTSNQTPTLTGTAEASSTVSVTLGGVTYVTTADANGAWSLPVTTALADGVYTPSIQSTDAAGNSTTANGETFTVDHTSPTLAAQSYDYAENSTAGTTLATVTATDANGVSSYSFGGNAVSADGFYQIDPTTGAISLTAAGAASAANDFETAPNAHVLAVTATDAAGNSTTANVTLNETNVNEAPTAVADTLSVTEQGHSLIYGIDAMRQLFILDPYAGTNAAAKTVIGTYSQASGVPQFLDIAEASNGVLYAVDQGGNVNTLYSINAVTGEATRVGTGAVNTVTNEAINALVGDDQGHLYASGTDTGDIYTIDITTGAGTMIGSFGHGAAGDLIYSNGVLYESADDNQLYSFNLATGAVTSVGNLPGATFGLALDSDGLIYGINDTDKSVFTFDVASGVVTPTGTTLDNVQINGLATAALNGPYTSFSGSVTANDTDPDAGDTKTITSYSHGTTVDTAIGEKVQGDYGFLTIAADGTYTYTLDSSTTASLALTVGQQGTDVFNYTIVDGGGLTSSSSLTVTVNGTDHGVGPLISGTNGDDNYIGTAGNDTFVIGTGTDTLTGNGGTDRFVWALGTAQKQTDTISDFSLAQNDVIDLKTLLQGSGVTAANIGNYVNLTTNGTQSVLQIDTAGTGNFATDTNLTINLTNANTAGNLQGQTALSLYQNGHLVVL